MLEYHFSKTFLKCPQENMITMKPNNYIFKHYSKVAKLKQRNQQSSGTFSIFLEFYGPNTHRISEDCAFNILAPHTSSLAFLFGF